jgi:hypothetical protein
MTSRHRRLSLRPNHALQRTASGRRSLQSARHVAAVAELGSLDLNNQNAKSFVLGLFHLSFVGYISVK